jgi:signal peptidase
VSGPSQQASVVLSRLLRDLLRDGRTVRLELTGHSMTPFIRSGDEVTLAPCPRGRPRPGDVVAYVAGVDRLVVHRIVGRAAGRLVARGDVAPSTDPPLRPDDVLGLVTRVERRGRSVRIGLGFERRALAWLSRLGLLRGLARLSAFSDRLGGHPPTPARF